MRVLADGSGLGNALIVNTCAVTAEAEAQARQAIRRAARENPGRPIFVTGCASEINPSVWESLPGVVARVGNADKLRKAAWTSDLAPTPVMQARDLPLAPGLPMPGRARAFLQVQQGCDHRCTFCIIPFGRGPSRSVPMDEVVARASTLVNAGVHEVVLTGVDIASWGQDLAGSPGLGALVRRLLWDVPGLPRLRLSSVDPAAIDEDLWRAIAEEPRLMPHLHLSAQHGSDLILKRMKRRHGRASLLATTEKARALRPDIALGADLIAGFPTEDDAAFSDLLSLVDEAGLSFLHVFPYSARPGTPASRMPQLPRGVVRDRAARLRATGDVARSRLLNSRLGRTETVLTEQGGRGHSAQFAPVCFLGAVPPPGVLQTCLVVGHNGNALLVEAI